MSQKNKISWNWNSNAGKVLQKCGVALFSVLPNTDLWYSKSQAVVTKTSSSQTKNIYCLYQTGVWCDKPDHVACWRNVDYGTMD